MRNTPIDDMIELALEELLAGSDARRRALVRKLCLRWPDAPALSISFALTSAASMIEDNLNKEGRTAELGALAWKYAALVAADVFAVESMGQSPAKSRDLLQFWRRVDGYFLEL